MGNILNLAETLYDRLTLYDLAYLIHILEGSSEDTVNDLLTALDLCEEERDKELGIT